jgi:serine/threonine protein kinase
MTDDFAASKLERDSAPPPPPEDAPRLAGYRVLGVLGRGGMGVVYKAEQLKLERLVAIKAFKVPDASGEIIEKHLKRFYQEARLLAKTGDHANIVQIFDVPKDDDGNDYLVMEYVPGITLSERIIAGGPLDFAEAARIAAAAASALQHAHDSGIIHRDIKPQNIMLAQSGRVKVMDFGIARAASVSAEDATAPGMILGTMQYIAPEQLLGGEVDGRVDIYSLSVTLFYAICGRPPFQDSNPFALAEKHRSAQPPPPSKFRADTPQELEKIILKGLEKKPEDRYQSAREFEAALERFIRERPSSVSRLSSAESPAPAAAAASPVDLFAPTVAGQVVGEDATAEGEWPASSERAGLWEETTGGSSLELPKAGSGERRAAGSAGISPARGYHAGETGDFPSDMGRPSPRDSNRNFSPPSAPTSPRDSSPPRAPALRENAPSRAASSAPVTTPPSAPAVSSSSDGLLFTPAFAAVVSTSSEPAVSPTPAPARPPSGEKWSEVWTQSGVFFYRFFGFFAPAAIWSALAIILYRTPDGYDRLTARSLEIARDAMASLFPAEGLFRAFQLCGALRGALPSGEWASTAALGALGVWLYWLMTTGLLRWVAALEHPDEDPQRRRKPIWLAVPLGALGLAICAALLAWLVWLPEARLWLEKSPPTSANSQAIWLTIHLLMIWAWAWLAYRVIVPWGAEGSTVADLVAPPSAALLGTVLYFDLLGLPAVTGALPALMAAGLHAALLSYLRARLLGPGRAIFWALALGLGFALTVWILRPGPSGPEAEIHQDIRLIAAANHVYAGLQRPETRIAPAELGESGRSGLSGSRDHSAAFAGCRLSSSQRIFFSSLAPAATAPGD